MPWLLLLLVFPLSSCHVSLTFPQSRYPPLDFLDSLRTRGPCGVPRPRKDLFTPLVVGERYNMTWRMSYPHQGGYRISVIDAEGNEREQLVPSSGREFAGTGDHTETMQPIVITRECTNCSLLIQRQAIEWGHTYIFHSCADVNVVSEASDETKCSGRGRMREGRCDCDAGYGGDTCNTIVHCVADSDCGSGGECVTEKGGLVTRVCYCPYGQGGRNCETQYEGPPDESCFAYNRIRTNDFQKYGMFNEECYESRRLRGNDTIYYRKAEDADEVEIILDFETTSWVGLGWRPEGLDPSCRLFPDLEGRAERERRSKREKREDNESFEAAARGVSFPPQTILQEGPTPLMPRNNGLLEGALRAPLHAMDCMDMVVGSVREGRSRLLDMYSRDRSTPLEDYWYDGMDSLSASYGIEVDGRTILMFRRPRQEIEPTDHPLGGTEQILIWAKGQTKGGYSHFTPSAVDKGPHSATEYYHDDHLLYHGDRNRGVIRLDVAVSVRREDSIHRDHVHSQHTTSTLQPLQEASATPQSQPSNAIRSSSQSTSTQSASTKHTLSSSSASFATTVSFLLLLLR